MFFFVTMIQKHKFGHAYVKYQDCVNKQYCISPYTPFYFFLYIVHVPTLFMKKLYKEMLSIVYLIMVSINLFW